MENKLMRKVKQLIGYRSIPDASVASDGLPDVSRKFELWWDIYSGRAPWLSEGGAGLELGAAIASEVARLVTAECSIGLGSSERAKFISTHLRPIAENLRIFTEYACAGGSVMFKPYVKSGKIGVDVLLPPSFEITSVFGDGSVSSAIFYEKIRRGNSRFVRAEEHRFEGDLYIIENRAFEIDGGRFGREIPLSFIDEWSGISERVEIKNLASPLFAYFKMPLGNPDLPDGALGVSIFSRAVPLLREADRQFGRLLWEFEGGELAVDACEDAFMRDRDGSLILPLGKERLFRANALDGDSDETLKVFSPSLRDESIINGLNRIIMFIEDSVGLARGTFSDPCGIERTATEIKVMKQRTYASVSDIQKSLGAALRALIRSMDSLCDLYDLAPCGKVVPEVSFGDSVLTDFDLMRERDLEEFKNGLMSRGEFRKKWYACGDITEGENK